MYKEYRKVKLIRTSLAMILCIVMSASFSARLPSHYPENFQYMDTLNRLDLNKATTVINGASFTLSSNLVVHTAGKQFAKLKELKTGQPVGVSYVKSGDNNRMVTEIWILPSGYTFPQL
mgnify:CR=1 FL=1